MKKTDMACCSGYLSVYDALNLRAGRRLACQPLFGEKKIRAPELILQQFATSFVAADYLTAVPSGLLPERSFSKGDQDPLSSSLG